MRKKNGKINRVQKEKTKQLSKESKSSLNKRRNQSIFKIIYIFLGIFLIMSGRYVYFMVAEAGEVINNPYNKRTDVLAEKFVRGKILAANGTVLAETKTDDEGKESRHYPFHSVFAHAVGSYDKGRTGIELQENFTMLSSHSNPIDQAVTQLKGEKVLGDNLVTTFDVGLQKVAYEALGNRKGAVVALEPDTGKVLAMVSAPSYDPNHVRKEWDSLVDDSAGNSTLLNRATQGLYAPGSTFKIVTLLEYIKEHPKDYMKYSYTCKGSAMFGDRPISCYNHEVHGTIDLKTSLAKSCNDSFAHIGTLLNIKDYNNTCNQLMFNRPLGLEMLYNQSKFSLTPKDNLNEIAQTAMGQGRTQITPLHAAMIVSSIANEGKMMKPYVIDRVETSDGHVVKRTKPEKLSQSMSKSESEVLKDYMKEVVASGTGRSLKTSQYEIAGKTGSAEFDSSNDSHAWFIGFAQKGKKKISFAIIVEGAGTGSEYAVPIAKKLCDEYLI